MLFLLCGQKTQNNQCVCVSVARQGVLPLGSLTVALFIHSFIHFTSFIWLFIPGWTLRFASLHFTFVQFHVLCTNPISCWPFSGCLLQQSLLLFLLLSLVASRNIQVALGLGLRLSLSRSLCFACDSRPFQPFFC